MVEEKMRANLSSGKGKSYFISVILFFILFIILFQFPFGIGIYREDEDEGLCLTCPQMNDDNLTSSEDKIGGLNVEKLEKIKKAIEEKGAKWVAGETKVSRYTFEDQKRLVGAKFKSIPVEKRLIPLQGVEQVPTTFDWRNKDGGDWMTPVRDQGLCGSCWAFGTLGSMEAVINIVYDDPTIDIDLSEQTLLSCSGAGSCDGGDPVLAYLYIMGVGISIESCFPYVGADVPCDVCPDWMEKGWRITEAYRSYPYTDDIKLWLLNYGPLGVALYAPDDFLYYKSGIYEPVYASSEWNNTFTFGDINHWVTLVGYDDTGWIVKNSWGPIWGDEGYGKIKYGILEAHDLILIIESVEPLMSIVSINVDPNFIDFGTIYEDGLGTSSVTITNGNLEVSMTATLEEESPDEFYTSNFRLNDLAVSVWAIPELGIGAIETIDLSLYIPSGTEAGTKTAMLTFWAETN